MMGRRESSVSTRWFVSLRVVGVYLTVLLALASVESMTIEVDEGKDECVIVNAGEGSTVNANYEIFGNPVETMVIFRRKEDGALLYRMTGVAEDYFQEKVTKIGDYELCFINRNTNLMQKLRNQKVEANRSFVGLDALRKAKKEEEKEKHEKEEKELASSLLDDTYSNMLSYGEIPLSSDTGPLSSDDDIAWYAKESSSKAFGFGLSLGEDGVNINEMLEVDEKDRRLAKFLKEEADVVVRTLSFFNDHESYMRGREEYHREHVKQTSSRLIWCTFVEAAVLVWVSWSQLSYIRRFFETKRVL